MQPADKFRFAAQAAGRHPLRSFLTVSAVAVGVAAVVALTAVGEAARFYVVSRFSELGSELLIVIPGRNETRGGPPPMFGETPRDLSLDDALALYRSPRIERVAPIVVGVTEASRRARIREVTVVGSTPEMQPIRRLRLAEGRFLPSGNPRRAAPVAVVGRRVARELFGGEPVVGNWLRLGDRRFRVTGILAQTGQAVGLNRDDLVIIPLASAQQLFDSPGLFRILVQVRSRDELGSAEEDILDLIGDRHEGERDVTVISQESVVATLDRIAGMLTLVVGAIAAISLLVAGVLIMNVTLVSVAQRSAEIGLLKALGATPRTVRDLFLAEAGLLAGTGALAGVAVAALAALLTGRLLPELTLRLPLWAVLGASGLALATALLFAWLPARRAARRDAVTGLSGR